MFAKLLKQEWRATRGIIGLLCIVILIAGVTIGGVANYLVQAERELPDVQITVCALLVVAGVMAVAICGAGSVLCELWRFYKSRFTDEGYLTFTLPVTHHQLLLSSILNSVFGVLLVLLACALAVGIAFALFLLAVPQEILWGDLWVSWEQYRPALWESFREVADSLALAGCSALVSGIANLIVLMLAVTLGAIVAKKHKILMAVLAYCGIGMVKGILSGVIAVHATTLEAFLGFPGILAVVTGTLSYFLMYWLISRKLDLT